MVSAPSADIADKRRIVVSDDPGFTGSIVFFTKEKLLPYDRTKLSKAMTIEHEKIVLRDQDYFNHHGIDVRLGVEVCA